MAPGTTQAWTAGTDLPREIDLDLEAAFDAGRSSLLERVAMTLGSTLELRGVLSLLARMGREVSGARHCSVFLLDGRHLRPTVAIGDAPDTETWTAFRSMGPITLDGERWSLLRRGEPVAIEDARHHVLIPTAWRRRFAPGAVVLVPLLAGREPCGLLALDWDVARTFTDEELAVLGALGAYAGVAVRNARLFEAAQKRARLQEAVTRAATALSAPDDTENICERVVDAYAELIGARMVAIGIFDADRSTITTVATRGTRDIPGPVPVAGIPTHVVERVWDLWEAAKVPVEFANEPWFADFVGGRQAGAAWYLLCPLVVEGHSRGGVLLGFEEGRHLDAEERTAITALASLTAAALERAILIERQERRLRQMDALYRVSTALSEGRDASVMVEQLNELLTGHGFRVVGVAFREQRLAQRLGADELTEEERAAVRHEVAWSDLQGECTHIPMRLGNRVLGVLRVKPSGLTGEDRAFLETLARGLAEVAHRADLRTSIDEARLGRAMADERERIASDLHDTAGQVFVAIGLLARDRASQLDEHSEDRHLLQRLAELSDRGKWEIDDAGRALAFVPATKRGLATSLRALAGDVQSDSGIRIKVAIVGEEARLPAPMEQALYRIAHEAIANAWRHARCHSVTVTLSFGDDVVSVEVADDGTGLGEPQAPEGTGIGGMRRAMRELGGTVEIGTAAAGGVSVRAAVSRRGPSGPVKRERP